MNNAIKELLRGLSPAELEEMVQASTYLSEMSSRADGPPEGSFGEVLNGLSPNVRMKFALMSELLETPRLAPFERKLTDDEYISTLEMDPKATKAVKAALDREHVTAGLQRKMGTDADMPVEEPSFRDQIEAAMNAHSGR